MLHFLIVVLYKSFSSIFLLPKHIPTLPALSSNMSRTVKRGAHLFFSLLFGDSCHRRIIVLHQYLP